MKPNWQHQAKQKSQGDGAKNPFSDNRYEKPLEEKAFLIIIEESTVDPRTDELFGIIRILKSIDIIISP